MSPKCFEEFSYNLEEKSRLTLSGVIFFVSVLSCTEKRVFTLFLLDKDCGEGQEDEGVWHAANILRRIQTFSCVASVCGAGGVRFTD